MAVFKGPLKMPDLMYAKLKDRSIVQISGGDANTLIENLITNSLAHLSTQTAIHSGLLSAQGKILFDFFVTRSGDDLMIDIAQASAANFIQRLTLYRLRADVTFKDMSKELAVVAAWGADTQRFPGGVIAFQDPRAAELGYRLILPSKRLAELPGQDVGEDAYHGHRITVGVPEAGRDFTIGETFPHEALYDQLYGVDFAKGCFVGQEVVSRMQHRGTARKRIVPVRGDKQLVAGAEITAGEASIGAVGSVADCRGLALMRLDRAHEAQANGIPVQSGDATLIIECPTWLKLDLATGKPLDNAL